ncbi:MAG: tetratricopeptide repeat protein [Spirochaetales bacterium]
MDDPRLDQAWQLYRRGRFPEAISFLEPQILSNRNNPDFYRVLGLCCLRAGDWKGGQTYLERALQLEPDDRQQVLLALIAVNARNKDYPGAVKVALEVLDENPGCRPARKALERLREYLSGPETGGRLVLDTNPLLPRAAKRKGSVALPRWIPLVTGVLVLIPCVALGIWWGVSWLPVPVGSVREGSLALSSTSISEAPLLDSGAFRVSLTADELREHLTKLQKYFQDYQDSLCRLEINRILLSNAPAATKERVRTLLTFLHVPDFARPEVSADFRDVQAFPELYEGCTVQWKGVVSNLMSGTDAITLDLLVGYQDGQVVEGVVPVHLGFAALLKNSQVVDVLGQVKVEGSHWSVESRGIHVVGYRSP